MSKSLRTALLAAAVLAVLTAAPAAALGGKQLYTNPDYMYIGKYEGSAVGGDAKPFRVIVYVDYSFGAQLADPRVTVVADKLGPLPVNLTVKKMQFETPRTIFAEVGVNNSNLKLYGNGTADMVEAEDGMPVIYGRGGGSFRGKEGSGWGKARKVVQRGVIDQVVDAGIEAASPPSEDARPVEVPPKFEGGKEVAAEPQPEEEESPAELVTRLGSELFGLPVGMLNLLLLFIILLILLLFGIL